MEEWKQYKLSDICDLIAGFAFKSADFGTEGVSVVKIKDIQPPFVSLDDADKINPSAYDTAKLKKFLIAKGDFLLAMTGATIGKIGKYISNEQSYLNQRVLKFLPKQQVDSKFVYYSLLTNAFQLYILNHIDSDSAQPNISANTIGKYRLSIPCIETQKRIADILSSLDDKIELNRRINDNLEQQAQALFKAWFVDFEPFKDGEFVDSELGMIPKDWKIKPLGYLVVKVKSGDWGKDEPTGNYTKKTFCMRGADFPNIKEGNKGKMPIRYILEKNFKEKSLCDGNVVVEISGGSPTQSTGRIVLVDKTFIEDCDNALICTNFCKSLEIKEDYSLFFYLLWQYLYDLRVMFIYENGSNGLKNLNVNSLIERESFVIPTKEVVSKFNSVVSNLLSTKQANGIGVSRLSSLRDTLLPRLMSGELKINDLNS